jgi:hypothetical protein
MTASTSVNSVIFRERHGCRLGAQVGALGFNLVPETA